MNYHLSILKLTTILVIQFFPIILFSQNQYSARVIQPDPISTPSICVVSVSTDNKNVVVWDKPDNSFIDYFKIYRESTQQTGKWDSVGFTPSTQLSVFIDSTSEPLKQSYRYKLSSVDKCGNETSLSSSHKTMNLSILKGLNNTCSLIWDEYEGFPVSSYRIYRGIIKDSLTLIGSTAAGNFNYNDTYSPIGVIYYQVEVLSTNVCNVGSLKSSSAYNSSRSNVVSNGSTGLNNSTIFSDIKIFPNPFNVKTTISFSNSNNQTYIFSVCDITGKIVTSEKVDKGEFDFYKGSLPEGLYLIELKNNKITLKGKMLIIK